MLTLHIRRGSHGHDFEVRMYSSSSLSPSRCLCATSQLVANRCAMRTNLFGCRPNVCESVRIYTMHVRGSHSRCRTATEPPRLRASVCVSYHIIGERMHKLTSVHVHILFQTIRCAGYVHARAPVLCKCVVRFRRKLCALCARHRRRRWLAGGRSPLRVLHSDRPKCDAICL